MSYVSDEEYEAELRARTPEEWTTLQDRALAAGNDVVALQHLMWRRDVNEWAHIMKMFKPGMSLEDRDFALCQICDIAETLRNARDNPEKRELRRWQDVTFAAAMVGSSKERFAQLWLKQAQDSFPATRGNRPRDDAPLLDHAVYAVECLLDALLMKPEDRVELEGKMHSWFMGWCYENDIGVGRVINGKFVQDPKPQVVPFPPRQGQLPFDTPPTGPEVA